MRLCVQWYAWLLLPIGAIVVIAFWILVLAALKMAELLKLLRRIFSK